MLNECCKVILAPLKISSGDGKGRWSILPTVFAEIAEERHGHPRPGKQPGDIGRAVPVLVAPRVARLEMPASGTGVAPVIQVAGVARVSAVRSARGTELTVGAGVGIAG